MQKLKASEKIAVWAVAVLFVLTVIGFYIAHFSGGKEYKEFKERLAGLEGKMETIRPVRTIEDVDRPLSAGEKAAYEQLINEYADITTRLKELKRKSGPRAFQEMQVSLNTMLAYASGLAQLGKYKEAESAYRALLPGCQDNTFVMVGLGITLLKLDDYRQAEEFLGKALAIEQDFDPNSVSVAALLDNLAALYKARGEYARAEPVYRRVLAIYDTSFDPNHPRIAMALNNLATIYMVQRKFTEAEPLMRRALEIDEAYFGPDHPRVAMRLSNLAMSYRTTHRLEEAESLMKRALAVDEAALGKDHPDVAKDLANLAWLYRYDGRLREAEPLLERALAIVEASYGKEHLKVAVRLNDLALLYQMARRLKEAETLYERALKICEKQLGEGHPNTETVRKNLEYLRTTE